jgi:hypothetical protein
MKPHKSAAAGRRRLSFVPSGRSAPVTWKVNVGELPGVVGRSNGFVVVRATGDDPALKGCLFN